MKKSYLLPKRYEKIGWIMFVPFFLSSLFLILNGNTSYVDGKIYSFLWGNLPHDKVPLGRILGDGIIDEISVIGITLAMIFICFSRKKDEDECISKIRLNSLVFSMILNYSLLIIATIFLYEFTYLTFCFANLELQLFIFMIVFNINLYRFKKGKL